MYLYLTQNHKNGHYRGIKTQIFPLSGHKNTNFSPIGTKNTNYSLSGQQIFPISDAQIHY
jgi:hypothetical protein